MHSSDATPDVPPPWEGPTVELRQRLNAAVADELEDIVAAVGCERIDVLDLLLRAVAADAIVDVLREQRLRDGAARAAWQRARRD